MGRNARLRKQRKALEFSPKNLSRVSSSKMPASDLPVLASLKNAAANRLGFPQVLRQASFSTHWREGDPWVVDFANRLLENPEDCNRAFEFWPDEYLSAEEILGMALESFSVSTEGCLDASGEWMYRVDHENLQRLKGICERRDKAMQRKESPWKDFFPASPPRRPLGMWTKMQWDEREDIDAG